MVNPKPTVHIGLRAWQKLMTYVLRNDFEIGGFGYATRVENQFLITDVFILPQVVTAHSVHVDAAVRGAHMTEMLRAGIPTGTLRFQWHSHTDMPAEYSVVDYNNIEKLGRRAEWYLNMVANWFGEYTLSLDLFQPFRAHMKLPLMVLLPESMQRIPEDIWDACAADIARCVTPGEGAQRRQHVRSTWGFAVRADQIKLET